MAYPVIGVMEHLDKSLRVFEKRLPTFFGGMYDLYYRKLKGVFFFIKKHLQFEISSDVRATQEYSEEKDQHQSGSRTSLAL